MSAAACSGSPASGLKSGGAGVADVPQTCANLIINELLPRLTRAGLGPQESPVKPVEISALALLKVHGVATTHQIRKYMDGKFAEEVHG